MEINEGDKNNLNQKRKRVNIKKRNKIKRKKKEDLDNIIIGNIQIKEGYLKQRIINSTENVQKQDLTVWPKAFDTNNIFDESKNIKNEKEIKNCDIIHK